MILGMTEAARKATFNEAASCWLPQVPKVPPAWNRASLLHILRTIEISSDSNHRHRTAYLAI